MAPDDPDVTATQGSGRFDVVLALGHQDLTPKEPGVRDPGHQRHRDVDARQADTEHGDDSNDQDQKGKRLDDIDEPHHDRVDAAAVVAGDAAEHGANDE